jgi:divalent metal cation (Fe/Co/Zn/Cd) transporter
VALTAIAAGQFYPFLDPLGGCLVSLFILHAAYEIGHESILEVIDIGMDSESLAQIKDSAQKGLLQGLKESPKAPKTAVIGGIKGRKSGSYYIVDVDVEAPGDMTVETFQKLKTRIVGNIQEDVTNAKIVRVSVAMSPNKPNGVHH